MLPWKSFPFNGFNGDFKKITEQMGTKDVHSYVNELIDKFLPQNLERFTEQSGTEAKKSDQLQSTIFETFDDVYVKLGLPNKNHSEIKISHTSNKLQIDNLLEAGKREFVSLPCPVSKKGGTAQIEDGILLIKLPKSMDTQLTELTIEENNI